MCTSASGGCETGAALRGDDDRRAGVNHFADIGMRELNHKGVVDVPDIVAAGYHIRTHPRTTISSIFRRTPI